jgi:DNA mismatch endonuclease (patch repair protein)
MASVCLRVPRRSRRVYAYLRWYDGDKTRERYICQVDRPTRRENLASAWQEVHGGHREGASLSQVVRATESKSWATSAAVRSVMRGNRGRDTRPELALRSAVHALGMRYRVNARPLKGVRRTADLVFPGQRVAVFLDGCFWHGCSDHYRPAAKNSEFWSTKIDETRRRDVDTDRRLAGEGWTVIRVWEHEDPSQAAERIGAVVSGLRRRPGT